MRSWTKLQLRLMMISVIYVKKIVGSTLVDCDIYPLLYVFQNGCNIAMKFLLEPHH